MDSSYFKEDSKVSAAEVVHAWEDPFKLGTLYAHFKRHQAEDLIRTAVRYRPDGKIEVDNRFRQTAEIIAEEEGQPRVHERALGEFIQRGRDMMAAGVLRPSASTLVAAIRTQAEIDAKNKDRKADLLKTIFTGASGHASGHKNEPNEPAEVGTDPSREE